LSKIIVDVNVCSLLRVNNMFYHTSKKNLTDVNLGA